MTSSNVRVVCRFRPLNEKEMSETKNDKDFKVIFSENNSVQIGRGKDMHTFSFDRVFSPEIQQEQIFELTAKDTVEDVLKGYNGTIFAYGQTGSGKTYTMFGSNVISDERGIIPRCCSYIFNSIANNEDGTEFTVKCSFLEIYKEVIYDLLNPENTSTLKVRESSSKNVWVEGLTEVFVTNENDIIELIKLGEKSRKIASTNMNKVSSRSHSLFIITIIQKLKDGTTKVGSLNLADLAGSERVGRTGATGETLEEAKKINQSLSALGNCIMALTKKNKGHVPYRDSKLTFILRESLGGNSKTTLLIACSPHASNEEETLSTLRFGNRAKCIKNSVKINQHRSVEELELIVSKQNNEILRLRKYISKLEKELGKVPSEGNGRSRAKSDAKDKPFLFINDNESDSSLDSLGVMDLFDAQIAFDKIKEELLFQIQDLQEELSQTEHIKAERDRLLEENKDLVARLNAMDSLVNTLEVNIENGKNKLNNANDNAKGLLQKIEMLEDKISEKDKEIMDSMSKVEKLNQMFKEKEDELNTAKESNQEYSQKIINLEKSVLEKEDKIQTLQNEASELKRNLEELNQRSKSKEEEQNIRIKDLENDIILKESQLKQYMDQNETLKSSIENLTKNLDETTNNLKSQISKVSQLENEIMEKKSDIKDLTNETSSLKSHIDKLTKKIDKYKNQRISFQKTIEDNQNVINNFDKANEKLQSNLEKANLQIEHLENTLKMIKENNNTNQQYKEELANIVSLNNSLSEKLDFYIQESTKYQARILEYETQLKLEEQEKLKSIEKLTEVKKKNKSLKSTITTLESRINDLNMESQKQAFKYELKFKDYDIKIKEAQNDKIQLENEIERLKSVENENNILIESLNETKAQLETSLKKNSEYEKEIEKLKQEKAILEKERDDAKYRHNASTKFSPALINMTSMQHRGSSKISQSKKKMSESIRIGGQAIRMMTSKIEKSNSKKGKLLLFQDNSWVERICEIDGGEFGYYPEDEINNINTFELTSCDVYDVPSDKPDQFIFEIDPKVDNSKTFRFAAKTQEEKNEWIEALIDSGCTKLESTPQKVKGFDDSFQSFRSPVSLKKQSFTSTRDSLLRGFHGTK